MPFFLGWWMENEEFVVNMQAEAPVNIVLRVARGRVQNDWYRVNLVGDVVSPPQMAGRRIEIRYMHASGRSLENRITSLRAQAVREDRQVLALDSFEKSVSDAGKVLADLMQPGQLVLFMACSQMADQNAVYWSSMMEVIGPEPERQVTHGLCRVTVKDSPRKAHVDILYPRLARKLENVHDLDQFFEDFLAPEYDDLENNANCLFRVIAPKTRQVILAWVYVARDVVRKPSRDGGRDRIFSLPASLEKTRAEALRDGEQSEGLPRVIAAALGAKVGVMNDDHMELAANMRMDIHAGEIIVEAIPGRRIRVIGDSLNNMFEPRSKLAIAAASCVHHDSDGAASLRFIPMTVGLVVSRPGGGAGAMRQSRAAVVFKMIPDVSYVHFKTRDIETAHYAGVGGERVDRLPEYDDQPPESYSGPEGIGER